MLKFISAASTGVRFTMGKLGSTLPPGLAVYVPFFQTIRSVDNRAHIKTHTIKVRTRDNAMPQVQLTIISSVKPEDSAKYLTSSTDPSAQLLSLVDDSTRSFASTCTFEELSGAPTALAQSIVQRARPEMEKLGLTVSEVLVNETLPPEDIVKAMNNVLASARELEAAKNYGAAAKVKAIAEGEAEAQRKALQGEGIAKMREAVMSGWGDNIVLMAKTLSISNDQAMKFMLEVLRLDTLSEVGKKDGRTLLFPYSAPAESLKDAFVVTNTNPKE